MAWVASTSRFILLTALGASSCVPIDGGAAEFSWTLRTFEGDSIAQCDYTGIGQVRLCWRAASAPPETDCAPERSRTFECRFGHGATRFEIAPGPTSLRITPVCQDGSIPAVGTFQVPPPLVRTVSNGKIITLNVILIVARDRTNPLSACAPSGCTCDSPPLAIALPH
jgi:hypothetical protein